MHSMEGLSRLFSPLPGKMNSVPFATIDIRPVITPHDTFYWQMLILQYHAYRLLILRECPELDLLTVFMESKITPSAKREPRMSETNRRYPGTRSR